MPALKNDEASNSSTPIVILVKWLTGIQKMDCVSLVNFGMIGFAIMSNYWQLDINVFVFCRVISWESS